ncbi:penicillin-binding protein activator LpoB [Sulfurimonas sp. SAG-AH-194-L11]|nr:penicillin-binding protein activator LpoB [Sulfurimonas sp. SAG-AH-194-L11]MDF1876348.1 penicillin-binding protein activator LpoB [Sulfurimonas sp. SAG-AH-194-L11]
MKMKILTASALCLALLSGCADKVSKIDLNNDKGEQVFGLDYRDFQQAASDATQSMLHSAALSKPGGGRYILAISDIRNDTMQHIDTDQLIKKIRIELLNSGKVYLTTAVGSEEDRMNKKVRELRKDDEFRNSSISKKGTLVAPDMSLSGKILQRNINMSNGKQQVEYYFMLTLTDLTNGFATWEGETIIGKRGSGKSVAW